MASNERQRFHQIADGYFEKLYQTVPYYATWLGIHEYDDQLGDLSAPAIQQLIDDTDSALTELESVDAAQLELRDANDLRLLKAAVENSLLSLERIAEWRRDPSFYSGLVLYSIYLLVAREFAPLEERLGSVIRRLEQVPQALASGQENVENPPRVFTEVAIEQVSGGVQFFRDVLPPLLAEISEAQAPALNVEEKAVSAFEAYLEWLKEDLLPRSNGEFAVGTEVFEELLRTDYMLDYTAEELAEVGRQVFDETKAEMERLSEEIDPEKTWPEIIEEARDDHPEPGDLLAAYREVLEDLKNFIVEKDLVTIPEGEELEVVETPQFARATIPYAAYMAPAPFEERQQGQFFVTPVEQKAPAEVIEDTLREHCNVSYPITALHEAYPGHHLQLVFSNQVTSKIRKHTGTSLFAEGWALYCEQLMGEQGYYDPVMHLFQLKHLLWRAARVIIDVGLHCQGMSIDEAVNLLVDEVKLTPEAARTEVKRYCGTPTQPSSYLAGKLEVLKLREEFSDLSLREFHDRLLSSGTVPFEVVREEMQAPADT